MPTAPVAIGRNTPAAGTAGTVTFTSIALVPLGGKTVVNVGWFSATATLSSIDLGGNAGTVIFQQATGSDRAAKCQFDAPSGLSSGIVVTATFSDATADSRHIAGEYTTGAATGAPSATTSGANTATTWSSGTITTDVGGFVAGYCYGANTTATNTATGDNIEVADFGITGDSESAVVYAIGTGGAMAATGTWTVSMTNMALIASWAATDAAVAKTLYMTSSLAGTAHQEMSQAVPVTAQASPVTGWILGTSAINLYSHFDAQTEAAASTFTAGAKPGATINTGAAAGNGWRSSNPWSGTFQAGTWTLKVTVRSVTAAYTGRFRIRARLYRAANAVGTGGVDIAGGADVLSAATTASLSTTVDTSLTLTFTVGQTTFAGEYILVTLAAEPTTAGGGTTQDADIRIGSTLSSLVTTTFPFAGASVLPELVMAPLTH